MKAWLGLLMPLCLTVTARRHHHCPAQNSSITGLQWSGSGPASLSVECAGRYNEMHCCAQAYTSITWWERANHKQHWQPFHATGDRYIDNTTVGYENETAVFKNVSRADEHEYKCVVTGRGHVMQQVLKFQLLSCRTLKRSPIFIEPTQNVTLKAYIGSSIHMTCSAFFGDWAVERNGGIVWHRLYKDSNPLNFEELARFHERVNVVETERVAGNALESIAMIRNMRESDYGIYQCRAFNGFLEEPVRIFHLKYEQRPMEQWRKNVMVSIATLAVFVALLTACVVSIRRNHIYLRVLHRRWQNRKLQNIDVPETLSNLLSGGTWNGANEWTVSFSGGRKVMRASVSSGVISEAGEWSQWQDERPWIQLDFEEEIMIYGIVIHKGSSVHTYSLFADGTGNFKGNELIVVRECQVDLCENVDEAYVHSLAKPINVRFLRLHVQQWNGGSKTLRWDLLGFPVYPTLTSEGKWSRKYANQWTVTFRDIRRADILATVSSGTVNENGEWREWQDDQGWIQLEFQEKMMIFGVLIHIGKSVKKQMLSQPTTSRCLKFHVYNWKESSNAVRFDLMSCKASNASLGVLAGGTWTGNGSLKVTFSDGRQTIQVSTSSGSINRKGVFWIPPQEEKAWIQLDFEHEMKAEGVIIQDTSTIQKFTLAVDRCGNFSGSERLVGQFQIPADSGDPINLPLRETANFRFLRLYVQQWQEGSRTLHWDLIGCPVRYDLVFLHPFSSPSGLLDYSCADQYFAEYIFNKLKVFASVFSQEEVVLGRSLERELHFAASRARHIVVILSSDILCNGTARQHLKANPRAKAKRRRGRYRLISDTNEEIEGQAAHPGLDIIQLHHVHRRHGAAYGNGRNEDPANVISYAGVENVDTPNSVTKHIEDITNSNPYETYINFVRGLLQKYYPKVVLVFRDKMKRADWLRLQELEKGDDSLDLENKSYGLEVALKSCKSIITWPDDKLLPDKTSEIDCIDEKHSKVKEFWLKMESAISSISKDGLVNSTPYMGFNNQNHVV